MKKLTTIEKIDSAKKELELQILQNLIGFYNNIGYWDDTERKNTIKRIKITEGYSLCDPEHKQPRKIEVIFKL